MTQSACSSRRATSSEKALRTRIAERARILWLSEGQPSGRAWAIWQMAEALVKAEVKQGYGQESKPLHGDAINAL